MPCYDDRNSPEVIYRESSEKINKLTRMLCGLCRRTPNEMIKSIPGLWAWWVDHQAMDRRREEREKKQKELDRQQEEKEFLRLAKKLGKKGV